MTETLYITTCVANPLLWQSRGKLARASVTDWLKEPNVHVTLAECAYGSRGYELADMASDRVTHVPLRATTMAWSKECLLNIAISRLPHSAHKIATFDADVVYRRPGWAGRILAALDLYPVIQPWDTALDLGPHDQHVQTHKSFASVFHSGARVTLPKDAKWGWNGVGPYIHPHPGYAWAWQRGVLDRIGGLFEMGGMGSGDHHMALSITGNYEYSLPGGITSSYRNAVAAWARSAVTHLNFKLGFVHSTIEHPFHGRKGDRGYETRWGMFLKHGFDPTTDLKRNTYGVVEFAGNKPDLERSFDRYLREREEDVNTLS